MFEVSNGRSDFDATTSRLMFSIAGRRNALNWPMMQGGRGG
jgi:hypothetical protein